ncbi:unnamed protein product [Parnassius apollo]|uniref:(apollo) hypothetical protein n=1 Tax=Parnassius apollo TaxID=110799 RepID=A0A8S3X779_PARAO|nr:unnamed protein product [Parnassius apollo]
MPKISKKTQKPHRQRVLRDDEIEKTFEEIYASLKDDTSDEEEGVSRYILVSVPGTRYQPGVGSATKFDGG